MKKMLERGWLELSGDQEPLIKSAPTSTTVRILFIAHQCVQQPPTLRLDHASGASIVIFNVVSLQLLCACICRLCAPVDEL